MPKKENSNNKEKNAERFHIANGLLHANTKHLK